jgi:integrase
MGLISENENAFWWRAYSSVNINRDGAVIIADPDDPSKPLREKDGKLAVRSLARQENGQPRFRRYITDTKSGKPFRIQQSTKLVDKDDGDHRRKDDLAVLILAKQKETQIQAWELAAGNGDIEERPNGNLTVAEFFNTVYLPYLKTNRTKNTYDDAVAYWSSFLKDFFNGSKTLKNFQPYMGSQFLMKLASEYSANTVKNVRAKASAIFAHAIALGYLGDISTTDRKAANPWASVIKNLKCKSVKATVAYTEQDIERILAALDQVQGRQDYSARTAKMLVTICFYGGLRTSEAVALRWENVHMDAVNKDSALTGNILVAEVFTAGEHKNSTKTTKNGQANDTRTVAMLPELRKSLRLWNAENGHPKTGLIFPNRSGEKPINVNDVSSRIIKETLEKVGLDWHGLYACRRGWGTMAFEYGMSVEEIAANMGNSIEVAFKNYIKGKSRTASRGMNKLAAGMAAGEQPTLTEGDKLLLQGETRDRG